MKEKNNLIHPVVLCGGSGTRLWPLSRSSYPKQFLSLDGERSFLQATVERLSTIENLAPPIFICHEDHRFIVAEQLKALGLLQPTILLEPVSKNTAPAIALASHYIQQQDQNQGAMLLVLAADHVINDLNGFASSLLEASKAAEQSFLVTFGCTTTRPETGYGYIHRGDLIADTKAHQIKAFVEKPNHERAQQYHDSNDYYWNSGMFLFPVNTLLSELQQHAPIMHGLCKVALDTCKTDYDFIRIGADIYHSIEGNSIDYAVMEKTNKAAVILLASDWADVGDWSAWSQQLPSDENGNTCVGDVIMRETSNCHFQGSDRLITAVGIDDIAVIDTRDALLLVHKNKTQDVKYIVEKLKLQQRQETQLPHRVYRPWGFYEILNNEKNFQVKSIQVNPGASLSLQMHHHRNEHWVIVSGEAWVTKDDVVFKLNSNESTYIHKGAKHRLENRSKDFLKLIEVQTGDYLGEDDIIRFEDVYGRDAKPMVGCSL